MPKGNNRRKHKLVLVVEFDESLNEREAVQAVNEAMQGDHYASIFDRKVEGKRGQYNREPVGFEIVRVERGDL
jgi:hypothetical protein